MMDATVNELRKAGQLSRAYKTAKDLLEKQPERPAAKLTMAWVLYDYLKLHTSREDPTPVIRVLREIRKLGNLPDGELFFEQVAFCMGTFLLHRATSRHPDGASTEQVFQSIEGFAFPKPSPSYSWMLTGFMAHWETWPGFVGLMNWWGWENFREEDFLPVTREQKQFPSLVEKLIGRYTKTLVQKAARHELPETVIGQLGRTLLQFTDQHREICKPYTFFPYYQAKVLMLIGEPEKAKVRFLPFAKKRAGDFWVWELLAQLEKDPDLALAFLVRAVSVKTKPEFLLKVREDLVGKLIGTDPNWAKTELDRIVKFREKKDWPLSADIREMMTQKWFAEGKIIPTSGLYRQYAEVANRQLMGEVQKQVLLITGCDAANGKAFGLNQKKETVKLLINKTTIQAGQVYEVSGQEGPNGWVLVQQVKHVEPGPFGDWLSSKIAIFRLHTSGTFGFVKDIFVPPPLVQRYRLEDGMRVKAMALPSYDAKKAKWGWQAYEIVRLDE